MRLHGSKEAEKQVCQPLSFSYYNLLMINFMKNIDNVENFSKITLYETSSLFRDTREYMNIEETLPDS
jgi:hypothetical protein